MNNNFPPNTDPNIFAFVGAITGAILSSEFNSYELNAIGNWLELVGQYLLAAAAQMQLLNFRNDRPQPYSSDINYLFNAIKIINEKLEQIQNELS